MNKQEYIEKTFLLLEYEMEQLMRGLERSIKTEKETIG